MALIKETQDYERAGTQKDEYAEDEVLIVPCPMCGSGERVPIYQEHGMLVVSRCQACSLLYTSSRIKAPERVYWGTSENYCAEARLVFEGKAAHHRDSNYLEELKLIRRYKPTGRFLDVGCNMGMLLRHVKRMGWTAVGVEPSPTVSKLAVERNRLQVYNCFLHELPQHEREAFDVIALSDVLEHIVEPLQFLREVNRWLAPGGIVYIKVPNGRWNLFKQGVLGLLGRAPKQGLWDAYEHVVHYTDRTLVAMLSRAGFDVLKVTFGKPVQVPVWHEYVGRYYQYPTPWILDWKRQLGRSAFYWLAWPERLCRVGSIGWFAPNIVAVARRRADSATVATPSGPPRA
jgi:SAM-dependent methyltransferase